mmetsp:Transcript_4146/g.11759  ORF Transcript_4146/g.11759 Transcript_4146/m.11759 type:complete len:167 (+) Transcript_4146:73-573(+)
MASFAPLLSLAVLLAALQTGALGASGGSAERPGLCLAQLRAVVTTAWQEPRQRQGAALLSVQGQLGMGQLASASVKDTGMAESGAAVGRPNGPLLMNRTRMSESTLPVDSRHINGLTVTDDWRQEYPTAAPPTPAPTTTVRSSACVRSVLTLLMVMVGLSATTAMF